MPSELAGKVWNTLLNFNYLYYFCRKKTCPHCRNNVTEKTISRVYFNVVDGGVEDYGTLVNKVENLQFQITLNKKDLKVYKEKSKTLTDTNVDLR